jgi:hypothetical protein
MDGAAPTRQAVIATMSPGQKIWLKAPLRQKPALTFASCILLETLARIGLVTIW